MCKEEEEEEEEEVFVCALNIKLFTDEIRLIL